MATVKVNHLALILAGLLGTSAHPETYAGHAPSGIISVAEMERWELYLRFGIIAEEEGQLSQALNLYSAAAKASRSSVLPRLLRGRLYTKLEEYESALEDLDEAVRLDPERALAYYMRGNVHFRLHNYYQAVENYATFLRLNSSDDVYRYDAHKFRGISFYALADCVNAKMNLEQALEIDPTDPLGHYYLGLVSYCLGEYAAAASGFHRSLDLEDASDRNSYYFAIWVYLAEERAGMYGHTGLSERRVFPFRSHQVGQTSCAAQVTHSFLEEPEREAEHRCVRESKILGVKYELFH